METLPQKPLLRIMLTWEHVRLSEDGHALVYINKVGEIAQNWVGLNAGKYVALGVGAYRKDIRLADLDGFEAGPGDWIHYEHKLALGVGLTGANIHFAYINTDRTGRVDYVAVEPSSGGLRVWLNGCDQLAPGSGSSGQGSNCQAAANPASTSPSSNGSPANINGPPSNSNGVPAANGVLITVGESTYTANSNTQIIIQGQTLTPGGQIVVGGTIVSLAPGASLAVVGGSTQTLAHNVPSSFVGSLVFGGSTHTANSVSQFVIGGQTLAPSEQITVFGTPISLAPGASLAVIGGSTQALESAQASPLGFPVFTLDGSTISADSASRFVIDGQTLTPGGAINVHGTSIMLPSDASVIVVGTSTQRPAILTSPAGPGNVGTSSARPVPVESATVGPALTPPAVSPLPTFHVTPPSAAVTPLPTFHVSPPTDDGSGDEITIPGYTTIASAPKLGGLPTSGRAAINGLRPAANGLLSLLGAAGSAFSDLAGGGASSLTSGAVSDAAGLFTNAIEDGESVLNAMNSFEMQSFDSIGGNLASDIDAAKSSLGNLIDLLRTTPGEFAQWISKPPTGLTDYRKIAAYLVGAESAGGIAAAAIRQIIQSPLVASSSSSKSKTVGGNLSSKTATSTSSSSSASTTPRAWTLNTIPGTSISAFESFVESLPDKGTGRRYTYSALDYQDYTGTWTLEQARIIAKNPLVDQMYPNDPMQTVEDRAVSENTTYERLPRVGPQRIAYQPDSPLHLRIISLPKTEPIAGLDQNAHSTEYMYEPTLGAGSFIYQFDRGFDLSHPEFAFLEHVEQHAQTNTVDNYRTHGTAVAGMAVGVTLGVAKKATLVALTMAPDWSPEDIKDMWRWVINDVKTKHRTGKAIILYPFGSPYTATIEQNNHVDYMQYGLPIPKHCDVFLPLLAEAWANDIITVVSAGNEPDERMGQRTPQRFGKAYNALITVGSMTAAGEIWESNTPAGPIPDGDDSSLTGYTDFYALSVDVRVAFPNFVYSRSSGSSLSTPQAAGLAAYLLGNPVYSSSVDEGGFGMKKLLRTLGRQLGPLIPIGFLINNGIRDEFCGSGTKVKGRELAGPNYDKHIPGSLGNESLPTLDRAIGTEFTGGRGQESSSGGSVFRLSLSSNQSSTDDFFTLPTQKLAMARDLPGGFPNNKPQPTFFTTAPDATSEPSSPTTTADSTSEAAPTSPATPKPTTTSAHAFNPLSGLNSELHSAAPSPTSAGVNGVQITDFNSFGVSLTFSRKPHWS
ncbi:MAG: hypothetical protein Q9195_000592 [Heterodermia aff. obscurata]